MPLASGSSSSPERCCGICLRAGRVSSVVTRYVYCAKCWRHVATQPRHDRVSSVSRSSIETQISSASLVARKSSRARASLPV